MKVVIAAGNAGRSELLIANCTDVLKGAQLLGGRLRQRVDLVHGVTALDEGLPAWSEQKG